ncbi:HAD-superfamily hydrolase, subfamily IA, variant 1 [uncultured Pleomorphomonas sp.]|uniref:phosphoglycolate phosphatase n=1 Tax=uncultured Pleomorphomonas sp. TaxID=442121 RepID=A0A212L982_9HYPH|nr:HAD family hydrolase [uncultured Pleomorphomonas sp.]SCM74096.1 HAD-superfamily hydrolase, subfamily IA, variant 1 [uncultured Pleomorphomonas sp.]
MPIRAVLFDKDGTLLDYHLTWGPINVAAADIAAAGDRVLADRLLVLGGMDRTSMITRPGSLLAAAHTTEIAAAWVKAGSPLPLDDLSRRLDALFTASATGSVPIGDLDACFSALRAAGLTLGIASSDNEASIRLMLDHLGLAHHMSFVTGYDSGHGVKPGPGMALAFAAALGLRPSEIAVVGDNSHDIDMGRSAGAGLVIGVLSGTGDAATLAPIADTCLADIGELPAFLAPYLAG